MKASSRYEAIYRWLPVLLCCLAYLGPGSTVSYAQQRSLDWYVKQAEAHSPALAEQQNRADSLRLQRHIIRADLGLPSVSATGDYMYAPYSDQWGYDPAITDGGHYAALLNVDYPVLAGGRKKARKRIVKEGVKQVEDRAERLRHRLKKTVIDRFIQAYGDALRLQYLEKIDELLGKQQKVLRSLADKGVVKVSRFKQLEIERQGNRLALNEARSTYQRNLLQLNAQCGIADTSTAVELKKPVLMPDSARTRQSRFMDRFKLDSLQAANRQAAYELKYQPKVSLYGNTGLNAVQFTGIENRLGYSVGLQVSVPLFDGGRKSTTRQQTKLRQQTIEAYRQRFGTERQLNLQSLQKQIDRAGRQLGQIRRQIDQYEELLSDYRAELANGLISVTDYLSVLRSYEDSLQQQKMLKVRRWKLINEYNYWNW